MNRVLIIGCSGSGKSTLARVLSERIGVPAVHLDRFQWLPGWKENDKADFRAKLDAALATDRWVMDGNYLSSLPQRLTLADTVIHLDFSRAASLWGTFSRVWKYRGRTRPDMTDNCPEKMDWEFFVWIWTFNTKVRPKILEALSSFQGQRVTLRSRKEVNAFLASLP